MYIRKTKHVSLYLIRANKYYMLLTFSVLFEILMKDLCVPYVNYIKYEAVTNSVTSYQKQL